MNNNYKKGRHNEYRTMRLLEASGFVCRRAAGSHSPFDVVAINSVGILLVQGKTNEWPSPAALETISLVPVPQNASKLVHRWNNRVTMPLVKEV